MTKTEELDVLFQFFEFLLQFIDFGEFVLLVIKAVDLPPETREINQLFLDRRNPILDFFHPLTAKRLLGFFPDSLFLLELLEFFLSVFALSFGTLEGNDSKERSQSLAKLVKAHSFFFCHNIYILDMKFRKSPQIEIDFPYEMGRG